MNENFIVIDATDDIVIGGFGNLEGNLGLLKYNKEDIRKMITENNNGNDNIRLINSLLQSLKELQGQLQQKEDIINKAKEYCNHGIKEYITDDGFVEEVLRDIKKILDNKGE